MKKYIIYFLTLIVAVVVAYFCLNSCIENTGVSTEEEQRAEMTPAVLDSIRSIGEWQLMTVPLTVEVDTVQKRWLGLVEDKLRRSYSGKLSLGVNLKKLPDEWSSVEDDTITLNLPDVCLLDTNFIDESKTRIIQSEDEKFGNDPKVQAAMVRSARHLMIRTGVNKSNLNNCRQEAIKELTKRFTAIGYKKVNVTFE